MENEQEILEREFEENHHRNINIHVDADNYVDSREFEYQASIERIDLDAEKEMDVNTRGGFIISEPQSIKKDLKAENGIFSTKFGQGLSDMNPFIDRYSCFCGATKSHINNGLICPHCGQPVKYVGDDYSKFGWIQITQDYYTIHPNLYSAIEYLFGPGQSSDRERHSKLYNIIRYAGEIDPNGKEILNDIYDELYNNGFINDYSEKYYTEDLTKCADSLSESIKKDVQPYYEAIKKYLVCVTKDSFEIIDEGDFE